MTTMRIAEVAERTGVPATTLRYYEDIGLLAAGRGDNGYRQYDDRDLERLAFIGRAKQLNISLDDLRELVDVWDTDDCSQVQHRMAAVVSARASETQQRIADLVELAAQLQTASARLAGSPATVGGCGDDCACMAAPAPAVEFLPLPLPLTRAAGEAADGPAIACSLDGDLVRGRISDWNGVVSRATGRQAVDDGVALTFDHDVALTAEIARLAAAEFDCCAFFRFTVSIDGAGVRLEVGAPPEARDIITAVFGAPA